MDVDSVEKERRLRLLRSAAASAINNGATAEEALAEAKAGILEAVNSPLYRGPKPISL